MSLYALFNNVSHYVFYVVCLLFIVKRKNALSRRTTEIQQFVAAKTENIPVVRFFGNIYFWTFIETALFSYVHYNFIGYVNGFFGDIVGTGANYFGMLFLVPVVITALHCFMGADVLAHFDIVTPALPAALIFVKIACFFEGCCYGIQSPYGVYFSDRGLFEVPVQLVESFNAFVLLLFLLVFKKFAKKGTMYPAYIFLYSLTRFFSEFLRHEKNIIWILKTYHILCIAGMVIGLVSFIYVTKHRQKLEAFLYRVSYKGKKSK